jgi:apolipoprotein N-acyltransferase
MGRLAGSIILLSGWRRTMVAILAGAIAVLGQAPYDFPAACFVAFPVLVWLLDGSAAAVRPGLWGRLKPSFATGYWFGFGYFLAGLWWIGGAVLVEADMFAWALPFAVFGIPLLLATFYGIACAIARLIWSDGLGRIFALAFGFGVAEWLRGFVLTGFPWNAIGYAAMPTPLLMQSVEVVGLLGMNMLAVFVFAVPALLASARGTLTGVVFAVLIAAAHLGYGYYRLSMPEPDLMAKLPVRLVQPNVDMAEKWDPAIRDRIFKSMLDLSSKPATDGGPAPKLIVWPETSVPYIFSENPAALAAIGEMLKDGQTLIAGAVREEGTSADGARFYNSVVQIDDSGQIVDAVDKIHLVPFGEYLPFDELFARLGIRQMISGPMNFAAGSERHALTIPGGTPIMPYICYEVIFPELVPQSGTAGVMLNVTNDAWFGNTPGPFQHLRQAQVRAVETRMPLIRAANTGISAKIDLNGTLTHGLALNTAGTIDAVVDVPAANFNRFSAFRAYVVLGLFMGLFVLALVAKVTRRSLVN